MTAEDGQFDTLVKRLEIDLAGLQKGYQVIPDVIVVTGDLAEWGRKREFDDALLLLEKLAEYLNVPHQPQNLRGR